MPPFTVSTYTIEVPSSDQSGEMPALALFLDSIPPFPESLERVLRQLFRIVSVARDEVEGLEEAFVFLREERRSGPVPRRVPWGT